jgi:histidinol-phosphate phosphatase family protein
MSSEASSGAKQSVDFSGVRFVFLDRDGVVNRSAPDGGYITAWSNLEVLPGVDRAIASLNRTNRKAIVVTNQRAVALGHMTESELIDIHDRLKTQLSSRGARLDAIYYCPHDIDQCSCRKPATGMFERAFQDFPEASPQNSVMIGDSYTDMLAGASLKMKTILITRAADADACSLNLANATAASLLEAVETFLL